MDSFNPVIDSVASLSQKDRSSGSSLMWSSESGLAADEDDDDDDDDVDVVIELLPKQITAVPEPEQASQVSDAKLSPATSDSEKKVGTTCEIHCVDCTIVCGNSKDLSVHRRVRHPNMKTYQCGYCNKLFASGSHWKAHEKIHEPRAFKCSYCKAGFTEYSALVSHSIMHSGMKPYECPLCKGCFPNRTSLVAHIRAHSMLQPYSCEDCISSYSTRVKLREHRRKSHPKTANVDVVQYDS